MKKMANQGGEPDGQGTNPGEQGFFIENLLNAYIEN